MPKVTVIGAGSAVFARQLITDILAVDALEGGTFALVDIDATRLRLAERIARRLVELTGKRWEVEASTERMDVLPGTDYVINSIEVAGLKNVRFDYDIPLRYGVDQCIGDTIGPGGIFKALRTGPAWLEIVADVQRAPLMSRLLTASTHRPVEFHNFTADGLSRSWGVQVVVANRPGGGGSIAAHAASEAASDGYTLSMPALSAFVL